MVKASIPEMQKWMKNASYRWNLTLLPANEIPAATEGYEVSSSDTNGRYGRKSVALHYQGPWRKFEGKGPHKGGSIY